VELRSGKPPIWSTQTRAWVTTAAVARDLVAACESRGWDIFISGDQDALGDREDHLDVDRPEVEDAQLW
jgi:hypothetical protein